MTACHQSSPGEYNNNYISITQPTTFQSEAGLDQVCLDDDMTHTCSAADCDDPLHVAAVCHMTVCRDTCSDETRQYQDIRYNVVVYNS